MRRLAASIVAALLLALPGRAPAAETAGGPPVAAVDVVGADRFGADGVRRVMSTRPGSAFSVDRLRDDVAAIWGTGYFDDVKVDASEGEGGLRLTVIVVEKPVISSVSFDGNKEIPTAELRTGAALPERNLFQEGRVAQARERILEAYRNKGFYDARVESSVEEEADGSRSVRFRITEGEKPKIRRIRFEGRRYFDEKALRKVIETSAAGIFSFVTDSGSYRKDVLDTDLKRIEALYQSEGFLDVKVADPVVVRGKEGLDVTVRIYEGIQYRVGKVDLRLPPEIGDAEGKGAVRLAAGGKASRETIVSDIVALTTLLNDRGYAQALVTPSVEKRRGYPLVDVTYRAEAGEKFHFGRVEVTGNTKTLDKVVRRELDFSDGALYGSTVQKESRENLQRTSYFKDVKITTAPGAPGEVDVNVEVQEGPTGTLSGGLGFSSVDKIFGVVNVSENNLFGRGWKTTLNTQFSSRKTVFGLDFRDPHLFDTDYTLLANAYNSDTKYDDFRRKARGGKLGLGYNLTRFVNANLAVRYDVSRITDPGNSSSTYLKEEFEAGTRSTRSIIATLSRSTVDRVTDPSRGTVASGSAEWAGTPFGGDSHFAKYILSWKGYSPVTESTVLSANLLWGHVMSTEGGRVPIYERFFLGGPYSVRGFRARSLSPEDPNTGERFGGNKEIVANLEYVFPLLPDLNFKGVLFFDAGNTWRQGEFPFRDEGLRLAAGMGLRWYSPMGPLRFEWGWNLDAKPGEPKRVAEFTIGTPF
jgi:outer membrane protein insertion porin family